MNLDNFNSKGWYFWLLVNNILNSFSINHPPKSQGNDCYEITCNRKFLRWIMANISEAASCSVDSPLRDNFICSGHRQFCCLLRLKGHGTYSSHHLKTHIISSSKSKKNWVAQWKKAKISTHTKEKTIHTKDLWHENARHTYGCKKVQQWNYCTKLKWFGELKSC